MEEYINEAVSASKDEQLLEAYDKEWALKDEGKREGYQEGLEQGKIEDARNMLKEKMDVNLISKITGLSVDKILEIKNKM